MLSTIDRIEQKCNEAKKLLSKKKSIKKQRKFNWGTYLHEYSFEPSGRRSD